MERLPRYKEPWTFNLKGSMLGQTTKRRIEISFPVYCRTSAISYPAGSGTYAAWYTMQPPYTTNYRKVFGNLIQTADLDYLNAGTSKEFARYASLYGNVRVIAITGDFIRTFTDARAYFMTLSCMSLGFNPSKPIGWADGDILNNIYAFYGDNNLYIQPLNTEKHTKGKKWLYPKMPISDGDAAVYANDWNPPTLLDSDTNDSIIYIGQNLPCVGLNTGDQMEIGHYRVFIDMEFSIPTLSAPTS